MAEDVKKKEEEKKEKEEKQSKEPSWFHKVPVVFKVIGLVFLYIQYQRISSAGGKLQEMYTWIILVLVVLYFLGKEGVRRESGILSPSEARLALKKEIKRMVKDGDISRWAKVYVSPNGALHTIEGVPQHYQFGVEIIDSNKREYKKGVVYCKEDLKGYALLQEHAGHFKGTEVMPVRTPKFFRDISKYGVDWDKMIFGEKK